MPGGTDLLHIRLCKEQTRMLPHRRGCGRRGVHRGRQFRMVGPAELGGVEAGDPADRRVGFLLVRRVIDGLPLLRAANGAEPAQFPGGGRRRFLNVVRLGGVNVFPVRRDGLGLLCAANRTLVEHGPLLDAGRFGQLFPFSPFVRAFGFRRTFFAARREREQANDSQREQKQPHDLLHCVILQTLGVKNRPGYCTNRFLVYHYSTNIPFLARGFRLLAVHSLQIIRATEARCAPNREGENAPARGAEKFFQKGVAFSKTVCYNTYCSAKSGPLVKRLRHRPLTAKTWVRFPYGSPKEKKANTERRSLFYLFWRPVRQRTRRRGARRVARPPRMGSHPPPSNAGELAHTPRGVGIFAAGEIPEEKSRTQIEPDSLSLFSFQ